MNKFTRATVALIAIAFSATFASAHGFKLGNLEIKHPWVKATLPGQPVGGGFLTIVNAGTEPDRLIKVTSDVSGKIQIHDMKVENGVMKMGEVPGGVEIAPGATVELTPGALHVMFMGLKTPFKEGEMVKAVLTFEKAGDIAVEFKVDAAKGTPDHKQHQTQ